MQERIELQQSDNESDPQLIKKMKDLSELYSSWGFYDWIWGYFNLDLCWFLLGFLCEDINSFSFEETDIIIFL